MGRPSKRQKPIFAKNVAAKRKSLGLSGLALAEKAGIPYPTLRDIEAGISGGLEENRQAIARALGVGMAELYQDEPSENEIHDITPHPDQPSHDDLVALGGAFALASPGMRALALLLLTGDDIYYKRAVSIPSAARIATVLKKVR